VFRKYGCSRDKRQRIARGHSGLEIDKGRGNAIKILNRVLLELTNLGARLSKIDGGNKRNAIPREAIALMFVPKKKMEEAKKTVAAFNNVVRAELASVEKDLIVGLSEALNTRKARVIKKTQQEKIFQTIAALPHGVLKMSAEISWLVETSTNVAVVNTTNKAIVLATSQRSSVATELDEAVQTVTTIFGLGDAKLNNRMAIRDGSQTLIHPC